MFLHLVCYRYRWVRTVSSLMLFFSIRVSSVLSSLLIGFYSLVHQIYYSRSSSLSLVLFFCLPNPLSVVVVFIACPLFFWSSLTPVLCSAVRQICYWECDLFCITGAVSVLVQMISHTHPFWICSDGSRGASCSSCEIKYIYFLFMCFWIVRYLTIHNSQFKSWANSSWYDSGLTTMVLMLFHSSLWQLSSSFVTWCSSASLNMKLCKCSELPCLPWYTVFTPTGIEG